MGRKENFSSLLLRWMPLVVLSRNNVCVVGDLIQFGRDMRSRLSDPPCLANMCLVNLLYIFKVVICY